MHINVFAVLGHLLTSPRKQTMWSLLAQHLCFVWSVQVTYSEAGNWALSTADWEHRIESSNTTLPKITYSTWNTKNHPNKWFDQNRLNLLSVWMGRCRTESRGQANQAQEGRWALLCFWPTLKWQTHSSTGLHELVLLQLEFNHHKNEKWKIDINRAK